MSFDPRECPHCGGLEFKATQTVVVRVHPIFDEYGAWLEAEDGDTLEVDANGFECEGCGACF